jgi:hypothetical protein
MAAEIDGGAMGGQRQVGALLFLTAGMTTFDAYSTLNSSPWTAENFGGDPAKLRALREYVAHAVVFSMAFAVASSVLAGSLLPLVGAGVANVYLAWLYRRAAIRAQARGSTGWS